MAWPSEKAISISGIAFVVIGCFLILISTLLLISRATSGKRFEYRLIDSFKQTQPRSYTESRRTGLAADHAKATLAGELLVLVGLVVALRRRRVLIASGLGILMILSALFLYGVFPGAIRGFLRMETDGGLGKEETRVLLDVLNTPQTWQQNIPTELARKFDLPISGDWIIPQAMISDGGTRVDVTIEFRVWMPNRARATLMDHFRDVLFEKTVLAHPSLKVSYPYNAMSEFCEESLWNSYRSKHLNLPLWPGAKPMGDP